MYDKVAIHVPAGITREVLKIHFTRYLRGIYVEITCGIYTVSSSNIRQIRGNRCSFWWRGVVVVVSSSFVCGALAFLFIPLSLFAPFPPALCVRLQLQCSSPWTMVVRVQTSAKCY